MKKKYPKKTEIPKTIRLNNQAFENVFMPPSNYGTVEDENSNLNRKEHSNTNFSTYDR